LHKNNTVKAGKFRKSPVKEFGIEFHLSHLFVI